MRLHRVDYRGIQTAPGKKVTPLLLSSLPEWYKFLFEQHRRLFWTKISPMELKQGKFRKFDLIIIVDTNSYTQLPEFDDYLKAVDTPFS